MLTVPTKRVNGILVPNYRVFDTGRGRELVEFHYKNPECPINFDNCFECPVDPCPLELDKKGRLKKEL